MYATRPHSPRSIPEPDEPIRGLALLQCIMAIVDQSEGGGAPATVLCAEAKDDDAVAGGLVELREPVAELGAGDV